MACTVCVARDRLGGPRLWGRSSAGRAPALQAGGHRFDPDRLHQAGVSTRLASTRASAPGFFRRFDKSGGIIAEKWAGFGMGRRVTPRGGRACRCREERVCAPRGGRIPAVPGWGWLRSLSV